MNAQECPVWSAEKNKYDDTSALWIESNKDIVIKNIVINGGECAYINKHFMCDGGGPCDVKSAVNETQKSEFMAHNKWLKVTNKDGENYWRNKKGEEVFMDRDLYTYGIKEKKTEDELELETLDEISKGAFITHGYLAGETLKRGDKAYFQIKCDYKDVKEVNIETSDGKCAANKK